MCLLLHSCFSGLKMPAGGVGRSQPRAPGPWAPRAWLVSSLSSHRRLMCWCDMTPCSPTSSTTYPCALHAVPEWAIIMLITFLALSCLWFPETNSRKLFSQAQGLCFMFSFFSIKPDTTHRHRDTCACALHSWMMKGGVIFLILSRGPQNTYVYRVMSECHLEYRVGAVNVRECITRTWVCVWVTVWGPWQWMPRGSDLGAAFVLVMFLLFTQLYWLLVLSEG